jgi:hypothetical protein
MPFFNGKFFIDVVQGKVHLEICAAEEECSVRQRFGADGIRKLILINADMPSLLLWPLLLFQHWLWHEVTLINL